MRQKRFCFCCAFLHDKYIVSCYDFIKVLWKVIKVMGMSNTNLKDKTIQSIMNKIHELEISKDAILTEADICKMFKISRTPAREALIELTANAFWLKFPTRDIPLRSLVKKRSWKFLI